MDIASQHATVKQHVLAESAMDIEIVRSLSPYAFFYFYYIYNRLSITTILL